MSPQSLPSQRTVPEDRPYRDSAKGNLIIRSADGIEFYVDKAIIANLSSIFNDMFSVPSRSEAESKPAVDVTEPGVVWDDLLGFCYFLPSQPFPLMNTVCALLEAAKKYRMSAVEEWMRNTLLQSGYVETQALRTYAVACAYGLSDVALVAARGCIGLGDDHSDTKELELITALQYTRLGDFRKRCGGAASLAVSVKPRSLPAWVTDHGVWLGQCPTCLREPRCANNVITVRTKMKTKVLLRIRKSWLAYLESLAVRLETTPDPAVAQSSELLGPVIASTHEGCLECRTHILDQAMKFSGLLVRRIETALYKVKLEM